MSSGEERVVWAKSGSDAAKIHILNDTNWRQWSNQIESYAARVAQPDVLTALGQNHEKAKIVKKYIEDTCGRENEGKVVRCANAFEAYLYLYTKYNKGGNRVYVRNLIDQMDSLKLKDNESLGMYFSRAEELQERLKDNGKDLLPDVLVEKVINGLPPQFESAERCSVCWSTGQGL